MLLITITCLLDFNYCISPLRCFSHCLFTQIDISDSVPYEMSARASICAGIHADLRVLAHCMCVCAVCMSEIMHVYLLYVCNI